MWGLGVSSFAAVTDQRVTTIRVHPFGAVEYQDGALEHINSGVVLQPSRFGLYAIIVLLALVTVGLSLLVTPWVGRAYYRFKKSGVVIWIREGVSIYMFCDPHRLAGASDAHARARSCQRSRRVPWLRVPTRPQCRSIWWPEPTDRIARCCRATYRQLANEAGGHARLASSIVRDGAITAGPQATFVSPSVPLTSPRQRSRRSLTVSHDRQAGPLS